MAARYLAERVERPEQRKTEAERKHDQITAAGEDAQSAKEQEHERAEEFGN